MITKNRIKTVLALAAVTMTILGLMTTEANAGETELVSALTALEEHITGVNPLTDAEIAAHKATIDSNKQYMGENATVIAASFDLVEAYDNTPGYGPLWINQGYFTRDSAPDDIHWTMYWVMQYIMDYTYTAANISSYEYLLDGFKFESSAHFPGAVDPPVDPQVTHTATIDGTYLDMWGHDVMHEERPARKPTGTYLAPGSIVTVTVPSSIVGKGYLVRVGAHSWDNSNRPRCRRLDRSSLVYSINNTQVKVASPLGGGIYIEVPEHEDAGIVDVQIKNAVRSPFFSAKSFHSTTLSEWQNIERNHPAPWADFQSEKFMMQVPTDWIYNFTDPVTLMQDWDKAMDALNDLMGYPARSRETMYPQVDLQFRSSVYAPGYPSVNVTYNPNTNYGGNHNHYLLKGPQYAAHQAFHEEGHGYLFVKFPGEMESTVNLLHVPVWHHTFGYDLDYAFAASCGYHGNPNRTLDNTAVTWMTVFNFSFYEAPMASGEKAYQLKGHAKFVDIAKLFGWETLGAFWYSINEDFENGIYWSKHGSDIDDLILRWCESVGVDLRPLFHFWGIHPVDPVALEAAIEDQNLPASAEIYDRLVHYKSLVPADNAAFQTFALNWWGHQPSINGYWTEREHTRQWDNTSYWQDHGWDYCGTDPAQADGEIYTE
ncbi:MAG: M60 family peptidase N-terminal accessory domain-containing protein, partial [Planctomycetota bacterium]